MRVDLQQKTSTVFDQKKKKKRKSGTKLLPCYVPIQIRGVQDKIKKKKEKKNHRMYHYTTREFQNKIKKEKKRENRSFCSERVEFLYKDTEIFTRPPRNICT